MLNCRPMAKTYHSSHHTGLTRVPLLISHHTTTSLFLDGTAVLATTC